MDVQSDIPPPADPSARAQPTLPAPTNAVSPPSAPRDATQVTAILAAVRAGETGAFERLLAVVYDDLRQLAHGRMAAEGRRDLMQTTALVHEAYLRLVRAGRGGTTAERGCAASAGRGVGDPEANWAELPENRRHLFAAFAKSMRRVLVDGARTRDRIKRGGTPKAEPAARGHSPPDGLGPEARDGSGQCPPHSEAETEVTVQRGDGVTVHGRDGVTVQRLRPFGEAAAALDQDPAMTLAVDEALEKLEQFDPEMGRIVELRYFSGLTVDETAEMLGVSPRYIDKKWSFARAWLQRELS